ncbi:XK-related protein 7a [Takifugu rubripes]|uniref:XK-related protein n=1 Tax=Takifugu rubripes TaxID=31033 RepID=Q5GH48_TAKRU|nr:XK-related protein 7a [Takifugu rubripes]AAT07118.1 XK-related protein 7a [Takifugu rubripes]|eukprot:NP_001027880.1 XK-related protein 7a [Takifugu rubripes]
MAAKSDGAAVSLEDDNPAGNASKPEDAAVGLRGGAAGGKPYTPLDCCWVLCALLVFFSDGATDLWLAADYYLREDYWWFGLTLVFVVVPSAVVQVLSFRWFVYDYSELSGGDGAATSGSETGAAAAAGAVGGAVTAGDGTLSTKDSDQRGGSTAARNAVNATPIYTTSAPPATPGGAAAPRRCCTVCMWGFQTVLHVLQLGQVWRYFHALYLGAQSHWHGSSPRRHFHWRLMFESADITMLRLLEAFLKSAPQLVLQLSIMIHGNAVLPLQASFNSSFLPTCIECGFRTLPMFLHKTPSPKMPTTPNAALYFRCVMTFWIIQGETDFCMSKWEEIIYNMVVGIIYIFCWFNVKEGPSRFRLIIYYSVTLAENVALTAAWYTYRGPHTSDSSALVVVCLVACSFALGTFFMLVYYCWLHPDGPVLGSHWAGCVDEGMVGAGGVVGVIDACLTPSQGSQTDMVITSPPRTLPRTKDTGEPIPGERDRDSCLPIFQVRPSPSSSAALLQKASSRAPEGPVIRIDLPRKRYPAWDAHFIDRRLRKTILLVEASSAISPRIQYRSSMMGSKEVLEYETTV